MFAYHIAAIDFFWEQLKTVPETAGELARLAADAAARGHNAAGAFPDVDQFLRRWEAAQQMAAEIGWEGDFRDEPVVFWLPRDDSFDYGFVIKQDNNGSTFVVSPVEMPWLGE